MAVFVQLIWVWTVLLELGGLDIDVQIAISMTTIWQVAYCACPCTDGR